jgi:hypothetical protein
LGLPYEMIDAVIRDNEKINKWVKF